jgi:hypothetical protein
MAVRSHLSRLDLAERLCGERSAMWFGAPAPERL